MAATAIEVPAMRPRSRSAFQPFASQATHAMGARIMTAGSFTSPASAVHADAVRQARRDPVSKYAIQPSIAAAEKNTMGVSEMKNRPKKTALGETANRNAAAR